MKKLFLAIRQGDMPTVQSLLGKDPALANCTAKAPPKKDDGQSPLQVSIKTSQFEIAHLLMDRGADIHYMEKESVNEWRMPVLHDSIRAAIFCARSSPDTEALEFEEAYALLSRLLETGASWKAQDTYGNNGAMRAAMDARQFYPAFSRPEFMEDLTRIFSLLKQHGCDFSAKTRTREAPAKFYEGEAIMPLLMG